MPSHLLFTAQAASDLDALEATPALAKRLNSVRQALGFLESNPRHPALRTHKYLSLSRSGGLEVFEAYAENKTPAAWRIFWHDGPGKDQITVLAMTPHP